MSMQFEPAAREHAVRIYIDDEPISVPRETTGAVLYALVELEPGEELFREGANGSQHLVENNSDPLRVHEDERFHTGREKRVKVIVNARERSVPKGELSYEEVVALAYDPVPSDIIFAVSYHHGPHANPDGELAAGGSVRVKKGMVFNVTAATRS